MQNKNLNSIFLNHFLSADPNKILFQSSKHSPQNLKTTSVQSSPLILQHSV